MTLWRNADFVHLWGAAAVSTFGSPITRTAIPFTAIPPARRLGRRSRRVAHRRVVARVRCRPDRGGWVDRMRRRPIMMAADLGRAALLLTVPAAAIAGWLGMVQILTVLAMVSVLGGLLRRRLRRARRPHERPAARPRDRPDFRIAQLDRGRRRRGAARRLALPGAARARRLRYFFQNLSFGMFGTVYLLYVNQEAGFDPGVLGLIFAVGGASAFAGAVIAGRVARFGARAVMTAALLLTALGEAFIPLARAANVAGSLGETAGLRPTLWLAVGLFFLAAVALAMSPVRGVRRIAERPVEVMP